MATTIRVDPDDKKQLEQLQAKILLETGEKLSFTQIIHYLLRLGGNNQFEELIQEIKPIDVVNWKAHEELIEDLGFSESDDIDEIVYGI